MATRRAAGADRARCPGGAHAALPPPLRLQQNGKALAPHRLTPRTLILAAARRASLHGEFHGKSAMATDWKTLAAEADGRSLRGCPSVSLNPSVFGASC